MKEDKASWVSFFQRLKCRGLDGVKRIVGDKCLGMPEAVGEVFPEAKYQRCTVHFYRNVFSVVPRSKAKLIAKMLKAIHARESKKAAREKAKAVVEELKTMKLKETARKVTILKTVETVYQNKANSTKEVATLKDLTYSFLHYFAVVAEEENITRAAKRLFISQPALSATMSRLEEALGFQLFDRKSNRIVLNEAGRCFLQYVNSALLIINEGRNKARQLASQNRSHIRIASSMGILRHFCKAYQEEHPENTIDLNVCDTEAVISAVANDMADFGINFGLIQDSRFISHVLMEGPYCVAVNCEHPLFSRATVSIQELSQYQLFCSNLAHTHEKIQSLFSRARSTCKLLCLDEKDVLFKAAELGLGGVVCLPMLNELCFPITSLYKIQFIPITGCAEMACVTSISRRDLYRSDEMEDVIAFLCERFQEAETALLAHVQERGFPVIRNHRLIF